jgi:hypothetical protein
MPKKKHLAPQKGMQQMRVPRKSQATQDEIMIFESG